MVEKKESKPFDGTAYKNEFNAQKYDRFSLMFPRGERDLVREHAKKRGESLNAFILRLIHEEISKNN